MRYSVVLSFVVWVQFALAVGAAQAQDTLLFCNTPEKLRMPGSYSEAKLEAGRTYTIFYHYKNVTPSTGPFVIALRGTKKRPLGFAVRKGLADPQWDPPLAGRQAMARYLSSPQKHLTGSKGYARFAHPLGRYQIASGVLTVRCDQDTQLKIYFRHDKWTVRGAHTVAVETPRRNISVALSRDSKRQSYRIGQPDKGMHRSMDGTYGMVYAFKVKAPEGRKVRVSFSPRGGKSGMVGSVNGQMRQTSIVPARGWKVFCEAIVGKDGGLNLTTVPFGGVFYPVELVFQLL